MAQKAHYGHRKNMGTRRSPMPSWDNQFLLGRTLRTTVRTEHTAITVPRSERCPASPAFIRDLTVMHRHRFFLLKSASWAFEDRFQLHTPLLIELSFSVFLQRLQYGAFANGTTSLAGCLQFGECPSHSLKRLHLFSNLGDLDLRPPLNLSTGCVWIDP